MDYRLVASPRATALRSFLVCLSAGALLSCAKAAPNSTGSGGSNGSGGSHASGGSNGSGGNSSSGGSNGSGGSSSSGGNSASGGNSGSGGNTGSGGSSSSGGNGSGGNGSGGSGGSSSSGGSPGSGGSSSTGTDAGTDASCQTAEFTWAPQIPTVFVLVDQSGSEFSNGATSTFYTLRTAALNVINSLQGQVRFAVGIFTGNQQSSPKQCPVWMTVAPDINNYAAINTVYSAITQPQFKAETPAVQVIPLVKQALLADSGNGAKYMLFVTDSETDFCDDGDADCPADAVTYEIQDMYASTPSIGTMIIGLPLSGDALAPYVLQNFANAGAGQPVAFPTKDGVLTQNQLYNQCDNRGMNAGNYSWPNLYAAAGKAAMTNTNGTAIATYSATGGTATVFSPASTSETDLEAQISAAINGVKSCTFDLSDVNGKSIKVDLTQLGKAVITVEGKTVAQDATNGWSMASSTELVLNGTACTNWRMPNTTHINFAFPCSSIIFE